MKNFTQSPAPRAHVVLLTQDEDQRMWRAGFFLAMKDAPAFDFYSADWLAGTATMTCEERGAYIQLLAIQWEQGGLDPDKKRLRAATGARQATLAAILEQKFPAGSDGIRRNARLEKVRVEQRARIQRSRDKIEKMNAARASCRGSTRTSTRASCRDSTRPSSPLTTHPVLLEKEPKGANAPDPPQVLDQEQEPEQEAPPATGRQPRKSGRALLRAEAAVTNLLPLPPDLDTPEFRAAWGEWCEHRTRLAGQGKPWSAVAHRNLLRQCCDNGEAWAIAEIRQALASGWQGIQWDQKRNPADVRSHPLVAGSNGKQPPPLSRMELIPFISEKV